MSEVGIAVGLIEETLLRMRAAGVTEQQLRSTTTREDLEGMGIKLGPRCVEPGTVGMLSYRQRNAISIGTVEGIAAVLRLPSTQSQAQTST